MENQLPVRFGQRLARLFFRWRIAVYQTTAVADVVQLGFGDAISQTRRLIDLESDQQPDKADPTSDDKHPVQA